MANTCFAQLVTLKDLVDHGTIFVDFPEMARYVQLNQLQGEVWNAHIQSENTLYHNRDFDTPGALLTWLVYINYGIEITIGSSVRYERTDGEQEVTKTTGTVQRCA